MEYKCDICGKSFPRIQSLGSHKSIVHCRVDSATIVGQIEELHRGQIQLIKEVGRGQTQLSEEVGRGQTQMSEEVSRLLKLVYESKTESLNRYEALQKEILDLKFKVGKG